MCKSIEACTCLHHCGHRSAWGVERNNEKRNHKQQQLTAAPPSVSASAEAAARSGLNISVLTTNAGMSGLWSFPKECSLIWIALLGAEASMRLYAKEKNTSMHLSYRLINESSTLAKLLHYSEVSHGLCVYTGPSKWTHSCVSQLSGDAFRNTT